MAPLRRIRPARRDDADEVLRALKCWNRRARHHVQLAGHGIRDSLIA